MPTREQAIGQVVGLMLGAGSRLVGQIVGPGGQLASQIKTLREEGRGRRTAAAPPRAGAGIAGCRYVHRRLCADGKGKH